MMCYGVITTITIFCRQLKSERLPQPVNHKNAAPVWDVFVGVWINVLLGQTKVWDGGEGNVSSAQQLHYKVFMIQKFNFVLINLKNK